jgi:two-component system, OmpR family, alkaline phosphatase synthesis response regulator PhoP
MNKNITVLIIEDEKDVRRILEYALKSDGFNVYSADNGQAGLKIAMEKKPDVILLDWVMPKMNGLKVLSKIRQDERTKDIIVVMLTAKNMMDDVEAALANGADDYIPKPFEGAELGPRIMSIVEVLREQKGDRSAPQKLIQLL